MMPSSVIVVGGGGHAKVVIESAFSAGFEIEGIVDPAFDQGSKGPGGLKVLGGDEFLQDLSPDTVTLINGIGSLPGKNARWETASRLRATGFRFVEVIDPTAIYSSDLTTAEGVQIMTAAVLQPGVRLGRDSMVNTGAMLDHDCEVGDQVHIAPGVVMSGNVRVGNNCHIGVGAVVSHGLNIGKGAVVGAGATVVRDVPDGETVMSRSVAT